MQYGPPPLFKQGTPARVKVIIFVVAAIALLFVDSRLQVLGRVRHVIGLVIYPIILDAAKVSAASGGNSEPKQGQRSQSAGIQKIA